jgi:hypothetical protein
MGWQSKSREENNPKVENKLQKVGAFFAAEKVVRKRPHSPRKPPQIDHKNTTTKHAFSPKSPAKTPVHHKIKILEN